MSSAVSPQGMAWTLPPTRGFPLGNMGLVTVTPVLCLYPSKGSLLPFPQSSFRFVSGKVTNLSGLSFLVCKAKEVETYHL